MLCSYGIEFNDSLKVMINYCRTVRYFRTLSFYIFVADEGAGPRNVVFVL